MWSVETEAPEEMHCDVQWAHDTASFTYHGCPFLVLTEAGIEEDGYIIFQATSVLHDVSRLMHTLVGETPEDKEDQIRVSLVDVVPNNHPHRPAAKWLLVVRPQWRRGVGPIWTVVEARWIPRDD
jgi:hypothetical protein